MKPDPAIDEIYEVRRKISAEFGDDPRRLMAHYAEYEKQLEREGWRFVEAPVGKTEEGMVLRDKPPKEHK
jgi:hypothetical protein